MRRCRMGLVRPVRAPTHRRGTQTRTRGGGGSGDRRRARGDLPCEAGDDRRGRVSQIDPSRSAEDSAATRSGNQEWRNPEEDVPQPNRRIKKLDAGFESGSICSNRAVNRGRIRLAAPSPKRPTRMARVATDRSRVITGSSSRSIDYTSGAVRRALGLGPPVTSGGSGEQKRAAPHLR
jgi:hypothetical protein